MMTLEQRIKKYDLGNSLGSLEQLVDQFSQTWEDVQNINYGDEYLREIDNIVIAGMGGSAYSFYVVQSLFGDQLKVPLILSNGYGLPNFVNERSLVIGSSYSGTTEETVSGAKEALKRGSRLTFISAGGKLKEIADENALMGYFFDPKHNPAQQPRMGQGYMLLGTIGILSKMGLIQVDGEDVINSIQGLRDSMDDLSRQAQELVDKFRQQYLIYVGAEHLSGNIHIIRNQTNETAKQFAMYALIPELNHHLMEGLLYPEKDKPYFVFFNSDHYSERIKKRFILTDEVVKKNEAQTKNISVGGETKMAEFMRLLAFGGFLTFYQAMDYGLDPAKIPWVDYFKEKLSA